jgi:hypothetical protein
MSDMKERLMYFLNHVKEDSLIELMRGKRKDTPLGKYLLDPKNREEIQGVYDKRFFETILPMCYPGLTYSQKRSFANSKAA